MAGVVLVMLAFSADAVVVAATHDWPAPASSATVYALLALAWALSLAAYFVLRSGSSGGGGGSELPPDPDPPWWPDFERDFRDYARGGPRPRVRPRPRQPVA